MPRHSFFFYKWHIKNNVIVNHKKILNSKKTWYKFFGIWQGVIYASYELKYQKTWDIIKNIYNLTYAKLIDDLYEIYITDFCRCFIKCYTNEVLHLNITIIFHRRKAYAILKK